MKYLLLALLFGAGALQAKTFKYDPKRVVHITGTIESMDEPAEAIRELSTTKKPIFIIINSYGGYVIEGVKVITAINQAKARKVRVYCAISDAAMSMATHIAASCTRRYAFKTSLIMWHPIAINLMFVRLTEKSTEQFNVQLKLLSSHLDKELKKALGLSDDVFNNYHENEYIQFAVDLETIAPKFLTIIDDIRPRK